MIPPLPAGTRLHENRYTITRVIAAGGMGVVYLAFDEVEEKPVAVKQTFFTDPELRKAFEREAKLLERLDHPNIPKVTDRFEAAGHPFLVMSFITGKDLSQLLAEKMASDGKPFPVEKVLKWADVLLQTLDFLHNQSPPIIHRDIKPANLKETKDGRLMLLDFGLAKGHVTQHSQPASVAASTPGFSSLEQSQNQGTDARSDIYSLAATMYQLLTGIIPPAALMRGISALSQLPDPLLSLGQIAPEVPGHIWAVVMDGLSLHPSGRPQTSKDMRRLLGLATEDSYIGKVIQGRIEKELGALKEVFVEKPEPIIEVIGHKIGDSRIVAAGIQVVFIPAGEFVMGSELDEEDRWTREVFAKFNLKGNFSDERPSRMVTISRPFFMGRYQVTQRQWRYVAEKLRRVKRDIDASPATFKGADLPVETVSWEDCEEFFLRLNRLCDGNEYALPTEAEWEYACRAGTSGDYAGNLDEMAWYANNSGTSPIDAYQAYYGDAKPDFNKYYENTLKPNGCQTHPVGKKRPNAFGLHDMHGNVWEWCSDWYDENYYESRSTEDPKGPSSGDYRVLRGGSWCYDAYFCRSAFRDKGAPAYLGNSSGFRVVVRSSRT